MAVPIKDGTGTAYLAKVDDKNRLFTRGVAFGPLEDASEIGEAAVWTSTYAATGGQEVIYIQNTEPSKDLHITRIQMNNTVTNVFTLFEVTSAGAATGTGITPVNPNLASGTSNSENSFGNATVGGTLTGDNLGIWAHLASAGLDIFFEGSIILGNGDAIALTTSATGTVYVTVQGFWDAV